MSQSLFQFGEIHPDYQVRVMNERAVRASAGILFFFAMITFMNAVLLGNFQPTRIFVIAFLIDFAIRLFVNPRYAPSLILGQWIVRKQQPEYVGAPQKRFAWGLGFAMALLMFYLMVINSVIGPINMLVCSACVVLMFFETSFGICLGCKLYNVFNKEQAMLCPGGVCAWEAPRGSGGNLAQAVVLLAFAAVMAAVVINLPVRAPLADWGTRAALPGNAPAVMPVQPGDADRCKPPAIARWIGHEEKWKQHNGCQ